MIFKLKMARYKKEIDDNGELSVFNSRERELLTESEIGYLSKFIGTVITIHDDSHGSLKRGKKIKIFCYHTKSDYSGEMVWNQRKYHNTNRGIDSLKRDLILNYQSELPGHYARLYDENWIFLAK